MTEYQTPTLGRIEIDTSRAGYVAIASFRVTTLGGRIRVMFDSAMIAGMLQACARAGRLADFDDWMDGLVQMPVGAER